MDNYQDFTCTQDMLIFLDACKEEQEQIFKRLNSIEIKLFDPKRKELKKERKELKEKLKNINIKIQKCIDIFEKGTTFERDIFLKFLARYLSLKERVVYVLMDNVREDDFYTSIATVHMSMANNAYPVGTFSKKYNIVTTIHNKQKLENQEFNGSCGGTTDNIKDYLSVCEDGRYLCLMDDSLYTLLNGVKLRKSFAKYPYMHELAYNLVDLKMANPMMDDEERLNEILYNLQQKKRLPGNPNSQNS